MSKQNFPDGALRIEGVTRRMTVTALLAALALCLSFLESLIPPFPLMPPGAKPGLSNIAVMFAASAMGLPSALAIVLAKAVFALITRGLTAALMSLAGGILSTLLMYAALKGKRPAFGWIGVGVIGAVGHNIGQLAAALLLTGFAAIGYFPFLMLFALPAGMLTGLILSILIPAAMKLVSRPGISA